MQCADGVDDTVRFGDDAREAAEPLSMASEGADALNLIHPVECRREEVP